MNNFDATRDAEWRNLNAQQQLLVQNLIQSLMNDANKGKVDTENYSLSYKFHGYTCECGIVLCRNDKNTIDRHLKTKSHSAEMYKKQLAQPSPRPQPQPVIEETGERFFGINLTDN